MYQFKNKTDLPFAVVTEERENWSSVFSHTKHITHCEKTVICQPASFSHRLGSTGQILHVVASQEEQNAQLGALFNKSSVMSCVLGERVMNGGLGSRKMQKFIQLFQKGLSFLKLPRGHTLFQNTVSANSEASDTLLVSLLGGYYETRSPFCRL